MNRKNGQRRAFTLFELMLVIMILGIAAAAILPAVGTNLGSPRLRAASNILASDIELCASECIGQPGAPRALVFNPTTNQYSMIDVKAGTAVKHPMDSQPFINDFATGRNAQLTGVAITSLVMGSGTLTSLTFDVYGKPLITADFVITLAYNGQAMVVTVKQGTGDVSIADAGIVGGGNGGTGGTVNDNGQNKDNGNGQKNGVGNNGN